MIRRPTNNKTNIIEGKNAISLTIVLLVYLSVILCGILFIGIHSKTRINGYYTS